MAAKRRSIAEQLKAVWGSIAAADYAGEEYVAVRRGRAPSWEELTSLLETPQTTILSLYTLPERSVLFILHAGNDTPVAVQADVGFDDWERALRRLQRHMARAARGQLRAPTWVEPLRPLLDAARPHVAENCRIILAAHRATHQLPWAATLELAGWKGDGENPPIVTTVPALGVLQRIRGRPAKRPRSQALVVGHNFGDLYEAEREATAVAATLAVDALLGPGATRRAVTARLPEADVAHFATHASFATQSPMSSSVRLSDGAITAGDALQLHLGASLVVFSACEAGISTRLAGEELAGLSQAFLHAGARAVIAALWPVDDASTAALMRTFHREHAGHGDSAAALSRAQATVRAMPGWSDPYFWAAFGVIGESAT
jgi:CHAT domain-containing protein